MPKFPTIFHKPMYQITYSWIRWTMIACLLVIGTSLTSCLDIEEEISLKRNGSGSYSMKVDMEQMMTMLKSFMPEEESGELNFFDTMDSTLREQVTNLRTISGLSNVSHQSENYTFTISYDFDKVETLNEALSSGNNLSGGMGGLLPGDGDMETGPAYSWTKKNL